MTQHDRTEAYADLLAALLAVRTDPATARFDAELAAAEARGDIDGPTARSLRWWQRESLRGVGEHLSDVLPLLLAALGDADASAAGAVEQSAASWAAATQRHEPPGADVPARRTPGGRPEADAVPSPGGDTPIGDAAHAGAHPPYPGTADTGRDAGDRTPPPSARAGDHGASRQRLLVAGLTVLSDGGGPGDPPRSSDLPR